VGGPAEVVTRSAGLVALWPDVDMRAVGLAALGAVLAGQGYELIDIGVGKKLREINWDHPCRMKTKLHHNPCRLSIDSRVILEDTRPRV
jgi:hypothetical protein